MQKWSARALRPPGWLQHPGLLFETRRGPQDRRYGDLGCCLYIMYMMYVHRKTIAIIYEAYGLHAARCHAQWCGAPPSGAVSDAACRRLASTVSLQRLLHPMIRLITCSL
jgi:hypothetical protein